MVASLGKLFRRCRRGGSDAGPTIRPEAETWSQHSTREDVAYERGLRRPSGFLLGARVAAVARLQWGLLEGSMEGAMESNNEGEPTDGSVLKVGLARMVRSERKCQTPVNKQGCTKTSHRSRHRDTRQVRTDTPRGGLFRVVGSGRTIPYSEEPEYQISSSLSFAGAGRAWGAMGAADRGGLTSCNAADNLEKPGEAKTRIGPVVRTAWGWGLGEAVGNGLASTGVSWRSGDRFAKSIPHI